MEDHVEWELGCEEGEEPLGGVHVCLQTHVEEVSVQIRDIFLLGEVRGGGMFQKYPKKLNNLEKKGQNVDTPA